MQSRSSAAELATPLRNDGLLTLSASLGPVTRARLRRSLCVYGLVLGLAGLLQIGGSDGIRAFGHGLAFPGVGFLHWTASAGWVALPPALAAAGLFALSLLLWFGTGNVVLPPAIWLGGAIAAAGAGPWLGGDLGASGRAPLIWLLLSLGLATLTALLVLRRMPVRSASGGHAALPDRPRMEALPMERPAELDPDTLGLMSLVLDRAQQPVDPFEGFEWRDQFQTAAIRYQLNFLSYALAMVRANHLPASGDYLALAQDNLLAKLGDHRVWRYWALENAWGRLRLGADPVPVDNIMYSGFAAAQMVFAHNAGNPVGALRLRDAQGRAYGEYPIEALVALLARQYRRAPFGLLACEPNWIYPLCNAITAAAIRGHDAASGRADWPEIAQTFRHGLTTEFMTASGDIVPFRSSLTGIAPPALGGAVMQAFPSFFLNSLFPDLAAMQWERLRTSLSQTSLTRAFWPIDVGNYGFSRASSYAASAAAAVEMGDGEIVRQLLSALDAECPAVTTGGARHRSRASLWAHALELTARAGSTNGLRRLLSAPVLTIAGPRLHEVRHPDALVARAVVDGGRLDAVLYPGARAGATSIRIAGLMPGRAYDARGALTPSLRSDEHGVATLELILDGRTELSVAPAT